MIEIGGFRAASCAGVTRRAFVHAAALLPCCAWIGRPRSAHASELAAERGGQARSIIFLWLWGGPSHIDTF
ncbi:MAG TPA: DUF1501 domain-containing protein, partial [Planctomycetota bacterium]|nr:DUF1501 domain-containing protein [Planctomycetota bacterium]